MGTDYNAYLDSFTVLEDTRYLRNQNLCRIMVSLGYRSTHPILTEDQFKREVFLYQESLKIKETCNLFSENMKSSDPVLRELAWREKANEQKSILTIIFMSYRLPSGFEVSGYFDFYQSLQQARLEMRGATDWKKVFREEVKFHPKKTDLSFYDWYGRKLYYNNSDNFFVVYDLDKGLQFISRGDRRKISVDPRGYVDPTQKNCYYSMVHSDIYGYVILIDHVTRKKF